MDAKVDAQVLATMDAKVLATMDAKVDAKGALQALEDLVGLEVPMLDARNKGGIGQWIERAIGLTNSSKQSPDVVGDASGKGFEIKTLPIRHGRVTESTYVTRVPIDLPWPAWSSSAVRTKLQTVVFVPIDEVSRRIGRPLHFALDAHWDALFLHDYQQLEAACIVHGIDGVTARLGDWLQLRPKAQNAAVRARRINADGALEEVQPKGFYLRNAFAAQLIASSGNS